MGNHNSSNGGNENYQFNGDEKEIPSYVGPRLILQFITLQNVPSSDYTSTCAPYIRAFVADIDQEITMLSHIVTTTVKNASQVVTWNSFRDFYIYPPEKSYLVIEVVNSKYETGDSDILGSIRIPMEDLCDESIKTFKLNHNSRIVKSDDNFTITIQRVFSTQLPPKRKTIYLVRHGQSKWNQAQASINIGGLLDRDHALSQDGISQAVDLHTRWLNAKNVAELRSNLESDNFERDWEEFNTSMHALERVDEMEDESDENESQITENLLDLDLDYLDTGNSTNNLTGQGNKFLGADDFKFVSSESKGKKSSTDAYDSQTPDLQSSEIPSSTIEQTPTAALLEQMTSMNRDLLTENALSPSQLQKIFETIAPEDYGEKPSELGFSEDASNFHSNLGTATDMSDLDCSLSDKLSHYSFKNRNRKTKTKFTSKDELLEASRLEYIRQFLLADRIYSSPLTRAIETAYVVLEGHPCFLPERKITLLSNIREIKKLGGLDTVGIASGEEIQLRVNSELSQYLGQTRADELIRQCPIDYYDCDNTWWTSISSYDSESDQNERMREFISFMRYSESKRPIFVGHSLFFKQFYSRRISNLLLHTRPELAENMRRFRLKNATVLALTIDFIERLSGCEAIILDADLVFDDGSEFNNTDNEDEDSPETAVTTSGSITSSSMISSTINTTASDDTSSTGQQGFQKSILSSAPDEILTRTLSELKIDVKNNATKFADNMKSSFLSIKDKLKDSINQLKNMHDSDNDSHVSSRDRSNTNLSMDIFGSSSQVSRDRSNTSASNLSLNNNDHSHNSSPNFK